MSFYTSKVKTHLIDPQNDLTNKRTEFRLGTGSDVLYFPNLRIANLGFSSNKGCKYNELVGPYGVIRQINLLDGAQVLDNVNQFNILQGFRLYNKSNEANKDLYKNLSKNNLGFTDTSSFARYRCNDMNVGDPSGVLALSSVYANNQPPFKDNDDVTVYYQRLNLTTGDVTNETLSTRVNTTITTNGIYALSLTDTLLVPSANVSNVNIEVSLRHSVKAQLAPYYNSQPLTNDKTTTPTSWLDLSMVFPMLKSIEFLHTGLFKKLKVVIEYESNTSDLTTSIDNPTISTTEPLLIADELLDENIASQFLSGFKGIKYISYEHDRDVLAEGSETNTNKTPTQTKTFKVNGFNQKRLERLLLVKNPRDVGTRVHYKKLGSQAQVEEKIQIRVNGQNKLPRDGAINHNERLGMLHDTFGECNTLPGFNTLDLVNGPNHIGDFNNRVGQLDYFGINIADRIEDLQIDYQRKNLYAEDIGKQSGFNDQINLNLYGEVVKVLTKQPDGTYRISYDQ